ncbi:kinase-like domain-containing protein, partial [Hysterangium stoloniferum]
PTLRQTWKKEIVTWSYLSHKNILDFIGVFHMEEDHPFYCMISSWMHHGTIMSYLRKEEHANCNRLILIHQLVEAIVYLHTLEPPHAHGDIKGANVLIDQDGNVKVSDLGLSSKNWNIATTLSTGLELGSLRWMAPERHMGESAGKRTLESDIWSLGMTILEILTGSLPYPRDNDIMVVNRIDKKELPTRPGLDVEERGLTDSLWELMTRCWHYCPQERPTAAFMEE